MTAIADKKMRFSAIDNVSGVVDRISSKFPKMTKNVRKTYKQFERLDKSSAQLKRNLSRMGNGMKSVGTAMTASLTLPIAAFGAKAFQTSVQFDKSMNKVKALTGANEKQLKSLRMEAKKLGSTTSFSASEAGDAMAFFGQAGWDTNQILKATGPTLALAAASGTDLARTADIMSNVMGGFNLKADEAGRVTDVLAKATAKGNINMEMMGESMKDAAPVAQKFGASIEEVSALTAKLGDAGIQGSKAGTTLKNMFLNLSAPTSRIKKIMGSLGVETIDPATGKMRKMTDILVDMNKAFKAKGLSDAKRLAVLNEVFGKRAIAGAGVLLNAVEAIDPATGKVVNTVAELEKGLINSTGHAKKMEKTMLKGLPGAVATIKSAFEGMMIAIMDSGLSEFLEKIIRGIASFFQWVSKLNPTLLKWAAIIAGIVAVIGPLIGILGMVISFLPMLITGFNTLLVILPILKAGMFALMLPFLKFIVIAGLIVGAALLIRKHWESIGPVIVKVIDFLMGAFKKFSSFLDTGLGTVLFLPLKMMKEMIGLIPKIISFLPSLTDVTDFFGITEDLGMKSDKEAGPVGDEAGSKELTKKNFEYVTRKQQASVDVKFSNLPRETYVMTDDRESILNVDTGMMGAL